MEAVRRRIPPMPQDRTLAAEVHAVQKVADAEPPRRPVQHCEERVVLRYVLIQHRRPEKCELHVSHLLPVDHVCVEVDAKRPHQHLDVSHRGFGVPTTIDVHRQQAQAIARAQQVGKIGPVYAATQTYHRVVLTASGFDLDMVDLGIQAVLIMRMPLKRHACTRIATAVALSLFVELDQRVGIVHHAIRANAPSWHHCASASSGKTSRVSSREGGYVISTARSRPINTNVLPEATADAPAIKPSRRWA